MKRFGPTQGELRFRLSLSLAALALLALALLERGLPTRLVGQEFIVVACLFFGGSAGHAGWTLWKTRAR